MKNPVKFILILIIILLLNRCSEDDGRTYYIKYEVTGTASEVRIRFDNNDVITTSIPWKKVFEFTTYDDEFGNQSCFRVINNGSDDSTITARIYVDLKLDNEEACSGPNCEIYICSRYIYD